MSTDTMLWDELASALEYPKSGAEEEQERYVAAFDLDPACSLNIGWHLFGDQYARGEFLAVLREELHRAGIDDAGELPDYLPFVLRLIPRLDKTRAGQLQEAVAVALDAIRAGVQKHDPQLVTLIDRVTQVITDRRPAITGQRSGT